MKFSRKMRRISLFGAAILAVLVSCSKDDDDGPRLGNVGESCAARGDCSSGLACVNERCVIDQYQKYISDPSTKQCETVQCFKNEDCCQPQSGVDCVDLKASCDAGSTIACDSYEIYCNCTTPCVDGACVPTCVENSDCLRQGSPGSHCSAGKCVACICDDDCSAGTVCRDNACRPECTEDTDCAAFQSCQQGVCVHAGCKSDRECIASEENVLAKCEGGLCRTRCSTDSECNRDLDEGSWMQACISGMCTDLGCQSDTECKARMSPNGGKPWVQCRAPKSTTFNPGALPPQSCSTGGTGGIGGTGGRGGTGGSSGFCNDDCIYSENDVCNDGRSTAANAWCSPGTDCTDCGPWTGTGGSGGRGGSGGTAGSSGSSGSAGSAGSGGSGGLPNGADCCFSSSTAGCSVVAVEQCVCDTVADCCSVVWDVTCAALVETQGCGVCQ